MESQHLFCAAFTSAGWYASIPHSSKGNTSTYCRTFTSGNTRSTRWLAPSAMARPAQLGEVHDVWGVAGLDSPLVGRQAEMAALNEALERLKRGVGGIVTIVGEAGIGKSRLVTELRKSQQSTDHPSPGTVNWL